MASAVNQSNVIFMWCLLEVHKMAAPTSVGIHIWCNGGACVPYDPESYAGGRVTTDRVSHTGYV
jgi:hypothetical protein